MSQTVLFIKLLLVHCATQTNIEANCSQNVSLECLDTGFKNMNFLTVTWYKIHNQKKNGIIRSGKGDKSTQYYSFNRTASFGEEYRLVMPSVTPEDSGIYECAISANVGSQNRNLKVELIVHVCDQVTSATTVFSTITPIYQVTDLPVVWSVIGYVAVGCTKVILSVICIWMCVIFRAAYRQQEKVHHNLHLQIVPQT